MISTERWRPQLCHPEPEQIIAKAMISGVVQHPEAYNLYQGLIDLARGIYFALDDFDARLSRIEKAMAPKK